MPDTHDERTPARGLSLCSTGPCRPPVGLAATLHATSQHPMRLSADSMVLAVVGKCLQVLQARGLLVVEGFKRALKGSHAPAHCEACAHQPTVLRTVAEVLGGSRCPQYLPTLRAQRGSEWLCVLPSGLVLAAPTRAIGCQVCQHVAPLAAWGCTRRAWWCCGNLPPCT